MTGRARLAALVAAAALAIAMAPPPNEGIVEIAQGKVAGLEEDGLWVYRGIPFAAPPVGALRWVPPEPPAKWGGVLAANAFKPHCMQAQIPGFDEGIPVSEDCLYLNVWSPPNTTDALLPVMVWIHGGAFSGGGTASPVFSGAALAKRGVVLVSTTYRLGALGFMAHPELTAESPHHSSGNYALLDLIAGLEWVRDNIAAFGGDPDNVTIFGESAGSIAIHELTVSPRARGLFHRAVGESGASMTPAAIADGLKPLTQAEALGLELQKSLGALSLAEMRALPAEKLLPQGFAQGPMFWPIVDGWVIPKHPYDLYAAGEQYDVPMLTGSNANEGTAFAFGPPPTSEQFRERVRAQFGPLAAEVLAVYPAASAAQAAASSAALTGDMLFAWNNWTWARLQSRTGKAPVFYYYFDRTPPFPEGDPRRALGATHFAEVQYVFGNLGADIPWTDYDRALSEAMSTYWVNFAKYGDPGGEGAADWPAFNEASEAVMQFRDDAYAVGAVADKARYEVIERYFTGLHTGAAP